jgi:hypothetical protein
MQELLQCVVETKTNVNTQDCVLSASSLIFQNDKRFTLYVTEKRFHKNSTLRSGIMLDQWVVLIYRIIIKYGPITSVSDQELNLQVSRATESAFNMQSRTADNRLSYS